MRHKPKLVSYGLSVLTATDALIGAAPAARCTLFSILLSTLAFAQVRAMAADLAGNVQGAGLPIAGSTVTLYAAGTGAPTQLAQGKTGDNSAFDLNIDQTPADSVLYELPPEVFQVLCCAALRQVSGITDAQAYGLKGQRQLGIDILARSLGGELWVAQCKACQPSTARKHVK